MVQRFPFVLLGIVFIGCAPRWYLQGRAEGSTPTYFECSRESVYGAAPPNSRTFDSKATCLTDEQYKKALAEHEELKRMVVAEFVGKGTLRGRFVCGDAYSADGNDGNDKVGFRGEPFKGVVFHEHFDGRDRRLCEEAVKRHQRAAVENYIATTPEAALFASSIRQRTFERGMPEAVVRSVFGWARRVERLDTADGRVDAWIYHDVNAYFRDGVLVDWVGER